MNFSKFRNVLLGLGVILTGSVLFISMDLHDSERHIKSFLKKRGWDPATSKYSFEQIKKNSAGMSSAWKQ